MTTLLWPTTPTLRLAKPATLPALVPAAANPRPLLPPVVQALVSVGTKRQLRVKAPPQKRVQVMAARKPLHWPQHPWLKYHQRQQHRNSLRLTAAVQCHWHPRSAATAVPHWERCGATDARVPLARGNWSRFKLTRKTLESKPVLCGLPYMCMHMYVDQTTHRTHCTVTATTPRQ